MKKIISHCPEETRKIGRDIAKRLKKGDIIAIFGELGAGKTCLVQGIIQGLDIDDWASSPSFTLINEYYGKFPVYHLDLYRLKSMEEILALGIEEYLFGDGVVIIEWANKIKDLIPPGAIEIDIFPLDENTREIIISGNSPLPLVGKD